MLGHSLIDRDRYKKALGGQDGVDDCQHHDDYLNHFPWSWTHSLKKVISKISLHTEGKALTFFLLCPILTFQLIQYTIIEQSEDD